MAKIRFWKWQPIDELGMPGPTRFPVSQADPDSAGRQQDEWSFEATKLPKQPAPAVDASPK